MSDVGADFQNGALNWIIYLYLMDYLLVRPSRNFRVNKCSYSFRRSVASTCVPATWPVLVPSEHGEASLHHSYNLQVICTALSELQG